MEISDFEGVTVVFICIIAGWIFGYTYHRYVIHGGSAISDRQFGWTIFGGNFLFFGIRLIEAMLFRHHLLVDGTWVYAWITPLSLAATVGFKAGQTKPTAIKAGLVPSENGGIYLVTPPEHREDLVR